ncbi:DUF2142 domain-containing protein [Lactococcus protaetiae]|uniref:DUF2142 domain-containing protein n=1 Tax=Lactococcus protaetiae TaxID=2592653 RepID=A0A514Z7A3_9LACT|nr:DUF2142 domain-containing protein [Lactococcus protaetiae]QDK70485.1 DUF2142 domain-containing protein [Lactococcus protaetiae]
MKRSKRTENIIDKNIHKIYLILALLIGMTLSIAMPLFNEPDGQYHYTAATNIAGLSNDLSAYGEIEITSGIDQQIPHYQNGNFFKTYFKNKIKRMPMKELPRLNYIPSKSGFNYWSHITPAIGVWIGHLIYPSMGVMVVVGRLFSTFISVLSMFFIIRWVKAGKLLFFAVSLSPVIANSFSSLSYDATTFVITAFSIALAINITFKQKVEIKDFILFTLSAVMLWFGAKTNMKILIILVPFIMVVTYISNMRRKEGRELSDDFQENNRKKSLKVIGVAVTIACFIIGLVGLAIFKPTLLFSLYRILISHLINVTPGLTGNSIFQSILASPYPQINYTPLWLSAVWCVLIVLIILTEKKYVWAPIISWFALFLFLLGFGAVYYSFVTFVGQTAIVTQNRAVGAVVGVQGRYFTPTLILFSLFIGNSKFKLKLIPYQLVVNFAIVTIIVSNALLLFGTLFGIYYLS